MPYIHPSVVKQSYGFQISDSDTEHDGLWKNVFPFNYISSFGYLTGVNSQKRHHNQTGPPPPKKKHCIIWENDAVHPRKINGWNLQLIYLEREIYLPIVSKCWVPSQFSRVTVLLKCFFQWNTLPNSLFLGMVKKKQHPNSPVHNERFNIHLSLEAISTHGLIPKCPNLLTLPPSFIEL